MRSRLRGLLLVTLWIGWGKGGWAYDVSGDYVAVEVQG